MDADNPQSPPRSVGNYHSIQLPKHRRPGEPENYRLSSSRIDATRPAPRTWPVNFWFRTRYISATAAEFSHNHPHILHLRIRPSIAARLIGSCIDFLPAFARSWVYTAFPEWFLPNQAVLKIHKNGDDDEEEELKELFDTEIKAYDRLKPLQGVVIPHFYGCLNYNGSKALLLERLGGVSLRSPEGATLGLEELSGLLQPCYRALHTFGVHHDDPQPANFQLVGGKIMVLDLERVMFGLSTDENEHFMSTNIWDIASRYMDIQAFYRREGWLEAA